MAQCVLSMHETHGLPPQYKASASYGGSPLANPTTWTLRTSVYLICSSNLDRVLSSPLPHPLSSFSNRAWLYSQGWPPAWNHPSLSQDYWLTPMLCSSWRVMLALKMKAQVDLEKIIFISDLLHSPWLKTNKATHISRLESLWSYVTFPSKNKKS